jgi:hypothetical protein
MNMKIKVWDSGTLREAKLTTPRAARGRFVDTNGNLYVRFEDGRLALAKQDEQGKVYVDNQTH